MHTSLLKKTILFNHQTNPATHPQSLPLRLGAALHVRHEEPGAVLPAAPDAESQAGAVAAGEAGRWRGRAVHRGPHEAHRPHPRGPAAAPAGQAPGQGGLGAHRGAGELGGGVVVGHRGQHFVGWKEGWELA